MTRASPSSKIPLPAYVVTDPSYVASTGIYHTVRSDGPLPYWVEARTYNKAPVVGTEKRVRGFSDEAKATRHMRSLSRAALLADPTLRRFHTNRDGIIKRDAVEEPVAAPKRTVKAKAKKVPADKKAPKAKTVKPKTKAKPRIKKPTPPVESVATDGLDDIDREKMEQWEPEELWEDALTATRKRRRRKPGPVPRQRDPRKAFPFTGTRFTLSAEVSNCIAQVWLCTANFAAARGRGAGRGMNKMGDVPHLAGTYAITRLLHGKLYFVLDDDGHPVVYPDWMAAERDAIHFWEIEQGPKFDLGSQVYYSNDVIEVHLTPAASVHHPFTLFDTRYNTWVMNERQLATFGRLDNAIEGADEYKELTKIPASARLAMALHETDEERMERELREQQEEAHYARIEAERARLYEQEMAELKAIAERNKAERARKRMRIMTPEEVAAMKKKWVYTTKPTQEQRFRTTRKKYAPRALKDQRGRPEETDGRSEETDGNLDEVGIEEDS